LSWHHTWGFPNASWSLSGCSASSSMSSGPMLPASLLRPLPRPTRADASAPYPLTIAWLYQQPLCDACEQALDARITAPSAPPPRLIGTRGHRRTVAAQQQCCPTLDDSDHGGHGRGNICAHGQPGCQSWQQLPCVPCHGSCSEMHSTRVYGQRSSSDLLVRVIACLAEDFLPFVNPDLSNFHPICTTGSRRLRVAS